MSIRQTPGAHVPLLDVVGSLLGASDNRGHPDRRYLACPRAPPRPRPRPGVHARRPKDEWLAARLEDLDYGDINGIEAAVREYPLEGIKKDEVGKELGYFLNNAPRMRYRWFRSRGLFVGSGVVEASCKTIVGQRLKQAGMHWTVAGADAIIALRCKEASSQREAICNRRHNQTGAA